MKKILMIVIDGLGDEYISELNGTPLEFASKELENLNKMAKKGTCGLHWPVRPGIPPSSGKAHLSLFGYDINEFKVGRGVYEALGSGMNLKSNEIAFRTNFATVKKENSKLIVKDRRAGRIKGKDAKKLSRSLKNAIEDFNFSAKFKHTVEHRGVFVVSGKEFSDRITDTDPHEVGVPVLTPQPLHGLKGEEKSKAKRTCTVIERATKTFHDVLKEHPVNKNREERGNMPANTLLMRGAGSPIEITSFKKKWGMKAAYTAEAALYKGVARFLHMRPLNVEEKLDFSGKNERRRIKKALKALQSDYDFVFLHIKLADNFSHSKRPRKKAEFLKKIDRSFEPILQSDNVLLIVTGDHSSSSRRGRHLGMPVPLLFYGETPRDYCEKFKEMEMADKGGIGIIQGRDILPIALDLADRGEELGIRSHPKLPRYKTHGKKYIKVS